MGKYAKKYYELVNKNHNGPSRTSTRKVDRRTDKRRKNHLNVDRFQLCHVLDLNVIRVGVCSAIDIMGLTDIMMKKKPNLIHSNSLQ